MEKWKQLQSACRLKEDLAIAYTPGVAEPCKVIAKDPEAAYKYTMKANTVAVVSDGSAVLGLETSVHLLLCRLWRENVLSLRNLVESMQFRSAWIHRIQRRSLALLSTLRLLLVESTWRISQHHAALKLRHA